MKKEPRGHLLEAQLSAGTVNARLAALKSFVTHAAKRKLCAFRLDDIKSVKATSYKDTSTRRHKFSHY